MMKKHVMLAAWLVSGVVLAVSSPLPTTVEYDPAKDAAEFCYRPSPPACELQLVASNGLVWLRYVEQPAGKSGACDTLVYEQKGVDQPPARIIRFIGRRMPDVVGMSGLGSLLFDGGEMHVVAGVAPASTAGRFQSDIRSNCLYEVRTEIGSVLFMERLWEARKRKEGAIFTCPVFRKGDPTPLREIQLRAVGVELHSGAPPSPRWIRNLWPIAAFDESGFTIWDGTGWKKVNCADDN